MLARFNGVAAFAAGFALAFVYPEIFFAITAAGGAAEASVRDDLIAGVVGDVGLEKFPRGGDEADEFVDAEGFDAAERIYPAGEAEFGFEDVADAGED